MSERGFCLSVNYLYCPPTTSHNEFWENYHSFSLMSLGTSTSSFLLRQKQKRTRSSLFIVFLSRSASRWPHLCCSCWNTSETVLCSHLHLPKLSLQRPHCSTLEMPLQRLLRQGSWVKERWENILKQPIGTVSGRRWWYSWTESEFLDF